MKISILTLFPEMFSGPFDFSIVKRAKEKKLLDIRFINIRDFGIGRHKIVDDKPYGGGVGMVLKVDVIDKALQNVSAKGGSASGRKNKERVILLDPRGTTFTQKRAKELSKFDHLILISGHYEGVDERIKENLVNETISIGNYVLTGGEIPAMVIVDSVARLIPGVLLKPEATKNESFSQKDILEHPQYTRPPIYKGKKVPEVLLSGNHEKIKIWKRQKSSKLPPGRKSI